MPRRKAPNPARDSIVPGGMFQQIPRIIKKRGRVKGFERMRDMALGDWELLCTKMNPYSALKLAIELDRHAMFAEVVAEKNKGTFDRELWDQYQNYLHGKVETPSGDETGREHAPAASITSSYTPTSLPQEDSDGEDEDE